MTNRGLFNWTVWISAWSALYTLLYLISPLGSYGVVYATFVALPIYFLSGAKKEEFFNFAVSFVTGAAWGWLYIVAINWMCKNWGLSGPVSSALAVLVITIVCVGFHFIVTPNTVFNKVPAMFGGISVMFSTGGAKVVPVMITLVLGTCLAFLCNLGLKFLTPEGKWCLPGKGSPVSHT